eukprot:TRINITY_DN4085_c0_g1_i12.p1 TRINITY_DN4085_c0_g1~~TRINITY_DN4085_c0_g1_i12.p1  ORF type:complete len:173 (+),score=19.34 TRINITY_DN4085_c0_g1_i12:213-731(+)
MLLHCYWFCALVWESGFGVKRIAKKATVGVTLFMFLASTLLVAAITRLDERLLAPLEGRIPRLSQHLNNVTGIILLGGSECVGLSKILGEPVFNEDGQRILKVVELAREYPMAKLVLTGGVPDDNPNWITESEVSLQALEALGVLFSWFLTFSWSFFFSLSLSYLFGTQRSI